MKARLIIVITMLFIGLAVTHQYLQRAIAPVPAAATAGKQPAPPPSRCAEKRSLSLLLMQEDRTVWNKTNAEALAMPGSIVMPNGPHKGQPGLPLAALIPPEDSTRVLEVVPCYGEPLRYSVEELGKDPQRYALATSQKGFFKLMDLQEKNGEPVTRRPLLRNIHAVRLLP